MNLIREFGGNRLGLFRVLQISKINRMSLDQSGLKEWLGLLKTQTKWD